MWSIFFTKASSIFFGIGEILEKDRSELMQIRNFGQKSMDELFDKLKELNLLPEEPVENTESLDEENTEE